MGPDVESVALIVPVECAQQIRSDLEKLKLWDSTYKLKRLENYGLVAVPISTNNEDISAITSKWPGFQIARLFLPISKKIQVHQNNPTVILQSEIKRLLKQNGMAERLLDEVPTKWEKHGDLVIVPAHSFSSQQWAQLGSNLWQVVTKCLACKRLAHHSTVTNDGFRSSKVVMLFGDNSQVTHTDNGIKYSYDVTKCMFSAGNITEKMRVASLDCRDETVVDLYAGIGYFTLPYLIHAKAHHVHACEWNPHALAALRNNLLINGVSDRCTVHAVDNRLLQLPPVADRVNLGLIPSSEEGWPVAVKVLKSCGGILHIHGNVTTIPQGCLKVDADCGVCKQRDRNMPTTCDSSGHFSSPFDQSLEMQDGSISGHNNELLPILCQGREENVHVKEKATKETGILRSIDSLCIDQRNDRTKIEGSQLMCSLVDGSEVVQSESQNCAFKTDSAITCEGKSRPVLLSADSHQDDQHHIQTNLLDKTHQRDNCEQIEVESTNNKATSKLESGTEADMVSSYNNVTRVKESFHRQEFTPLCLKSSGKGHTTLACDEWSLSVQRKIVSLLETTKGGVWVVKQLHMELVKSYAPHIVHVVLDLECRPFEEESGKLLE